MYYKFNIALKKQPPVGCGQVLGGDYDGADLEET